MAAIHIPALAIAAACLFAGTAADTPRFVCKAGVTVERTLEMKGTRTLESYTERAGAERRDHTEVQRHAVMSYKQVVQDEIRGCAEDRVTVLARTYVVLEKGRSEKIKTPKGEDTKETPETSELAGKQVVFTWNAGKQIHARTIGGTSTEAPASDPATSEALTADLEVDMDYRGFLPEAGAVAGAKWEIDFAAVKTALLRPGGDVPFKAKAEARSMDKRLRKLAWDATRGKLDLELGAVREEAGKKLVTISFRGDMSFDASTSPEGDEKGPERLRIADAQELEGKLVWNVDAGRPHSLAWSSKGTITQTAAGKATMAGSGDVVELEEVQVFDEEFAYTGTFTVR